MKPFRELPARLQVLLVGIPALWLGALVVAGSAARAPSAMELAGAGLLALLVAAADLRPLAFAPRQKTSLAAAPGVAAALLLPPALASAACGLAVLAATLVLARRTRNAVFNAGSAGLAVLGGSVIRGSESPDMPAGAVLLAGGALFTAFLPLLFAAFAAAAHEGTPGLRTVAAAAAGGWPQSLATAAVGLVVALTWAETPWAAVAVVAVLPQVYRAARLAAAEVARANELDQLVLTQRRFLTDLTHEVGNPLTTIRANLSVLGSGRLGTQARRAREDAEAEAVHLGELFRQLRVLAETDEANAMRIERLDLGTVALDVVRAFAAEADSRGVSIVCDATQASVDGDPSLLRQAAANLVDNAVRHSSSGSAIRVAVSAAGNEALLEVADSGPGIEPGLLPLLFERFETGPGGRSGLGLSIARNLVQRHGGRIDVESEPGVGSRFVIVLPQPGPALRRPPQPIASN